MTAKRLLDDVMIAAPCSVGWDNMSGDDKIRFCEKCQLNVYNLSGMSDDEAENLLQINGSNICISLFRREDGTILKENCPVGLEKVRARLLKAKSGGNKLARIAAAAALFLLGTVAHAEDKKPVPLTGSPAPIAPNANPNSNANANEKCDPNKAQQQGQAQQTNHPYATRTAGIIARPSDLEKNEHPLELKGEADGTAFKFYSEARKNQLSGNLLLAETNYKKALAEALKDTHDPKFRAKIRNDYAKFLISQNRKKEARELPR